LHCSYFLGKIGESEIHVHPTLGEVEERVRVVSRQRAEAARRQRIGTGATLQKVCRATKVFRPDRRDQFFSSGFSLLF